MQYIVDMVDRLTCNVDVAGKRVLEVGGDGSYVAAKLLIERGAASVVTTNIDHRHDFLRGEPRITSSFADAHFLHRYFEQKFDIVLGIAVIEHILNIPMWLEATRNVLVPDGCAFYHGGPIWSCRRGHHIWVTGAKGVHYRFNEQREIIPGWSHLFWTPSKMREHLIGVEKIPEDDADAICHWVYFAPSINRHTHRRLEALFDRAPLKMVRRIPDIGAMPDAEMAARLNEAVGDGSDFSIAAMTYLLQNA